nr:MAG TPA: HNHc [Caudoviricetes sp.]
MNNKNSFILHDGFFELLAALPPDKCKEMLMAYGNYALKGEVTTFDDPLMAAVFAREKSIADSDIRKYANKSEVRRAAALKKWGAESSDGVTNRSKRLAEARAKGTHTKSEWDEMRNFFGYCVKCGKSAEDVELVKDHIIPIYQGGSDSITNLQPLCRSCNSSKGPDSKDYRLKFCDEKRLQMPAKWVQTPATPATPADTDTDTDTDTGLFLKKEIKEKKPSSKKGNQDLRKTDPIHRSPLDGKEKGCAEKEKPAGRYVVVGQLGAVLLAEQGWIEAMCMNLHKERDYIERRIGEFVGELVVSGCDGRDLSDAKRHFRNWLRKIENLPNQNNGNQQQRGCTDEELIAAVYEGYARAHTKQPWEK